MSQAETLQGLGWRSFFQSQVDPDAGHRPARVLGVHRDRVELAHAEGLESLPLSRTAAELRITVGDWVLLDAHEATITGLLERFGLFQRRAAGSSAEIQLIAANVDTLFIVTSANRDFNVARLERYLAIAHEAGAYPVIVITKADQVESPDEHVAMARRLSPGVLVEALDARDPEQVAVLKPWCEPGQTVALLGSSGVGKSTLVNSLAGTEQDTRQARADDQRGRHTTTARSMHPLAEGGWLIDTPGMRELQLVDVGDALHEVFAEIAELAGDCRFADCSHVSEPGCAVLAAIEAGTLDEDRLRRYRKLRREDERNSESIAERRSRDRDLGRFYKSVLAGKQQEKGGKK